VLLVDDDDNAPDLQPSYTTALTGLGVSFTVFDVGGGAGDGPSADQMAPYLLVIWFSGDKFGGPDTPMAGPNARDEADLTTYLANGGHLFLDSQDYLYDMGLTAFGRNRLGIASYTDDINFDATAILGQPDDPIGAAYPALPISSPPGFAAYYDSVSPDSSARTAFVAQGGAGTSTNIDTLSAETVFFSTEWTSVYNSSPSDGQALLGTIIAFLGGCGPTPTPTSPPTPTSTPAPTHTPIPGAWLDKAPLPANVMDACAVEDGRYVYVIGGYDGARAVADLRRYDTLADNWLLLSPMPVPLSGQRCVVADGQIYVPGGWDGAGDPQAVLYIYDIAAGTWSTGAAPPSGRAAYGIALINGKLYRVGGCTDAACNGTVSNNLDIYDIAADQWSSGANYPSNIGWHMCGAIDGFLYCIGGINSFPAAVGKGYRYDPVGDMWSDADMADFPSDAANPPGTIWAAGTAVEGGEMAVFGGVMDGFATITNRAWRFTPGAGGGLWSEFQPMMYAVHRLAGAAGSLYAEGGSLSGFAATNYNQKWAASEMSSPTPTPVPPSATPTDTPAPPTDTPTYTITPTGTWTPTPTSSPTGTPTGTATSTLTPMPTFTPTTMVTLTPTPTPTPVSYWIYLPLSLR